METPMSVISDPEKHVSSPNEANGTLTEAGEGPQQVTLSLPRPATKEEIETLPHVMGSIPITTWLLVFTGSAASFAKYGVTTPFQNYIQNPPGNSLLPGALGMGQAKATIIQNFFIFFSFLTPLPFGILSDAWLGRYRTMVCSLALLMLGYIILLVTSLPIAPQNGAGLAGLIASMVFMGLGQGGLSAIMFVFIGDQLPDTNPTVMTSKKGHLVVTDHTMTVQFVFNTYFWASNIASMSMVATTFMERHIQFWAAFLMPTCVLAISIIPVLLWNKQLVKLPPQGNVLPQALRVLTIACKSGFHLSAAEPSHQQAQTQQPVPWPSTFITEIRRGLHACKVLLAFTIFWLCYNQITTNLISQAGQMRTAGTISNDTILTLNVAAVILLSPALQALQTTLHRRKIPFGPIRRITLAFIFTAAALAYAAGLQALIYARGPCYTRPLACAAAETETPGVRRPNEVSVWLQTPVYVLLAVGEILGYVAVTEYAYAEAPARMKALVQALGQLTAAVGAAVGMALGPVSRDPWLVVLYACLAGGDGGGFGGVLGGVSEV